MKKIILLIIIMLTCSQMLTAKEVKGDTLSINGTKLIRLYGNHYERGYAYGYLLAEQIYDVYKNYFVDYAMWTMKPYYDMLLVNFNSQAVIDERFASEAQGIIDGIQDTDFADKFNMIWSREFSAQDLIFANAIVELTSNFGCSALMSWGESTEDDAKLTGELVITRHLDWVNTPALYRNHVIAAHYPLESDEQRWVSFGVAGLFGLLSGANESGVGAFQHMGNTNYFNMDQAFEPIFLTLRKAIERKDINGDNLSRTDDVVDAVYAQTQGGTFIIDVVNSIGKADSAVVIECSGTQKAVRFKGDAHSQVPGTNLVATNHFRKLDTPESCERYDALQYLLLNNSDVTIETNWNYVKDGAGLSNNMQVIQFIPATMDFRIGFANEDKLGWEQTPFAFNFEDLYSLSSIEERRDFAVSLSSIAPNPAVNFTQVDFSLESNSNVIIELVGTDGKTIGSFNQGELSAGRHIVQIPLSNLSDGVYFLRINTNNSFITNKVIVVR